MQLSKNNGEIWINIQIDDSMRLKENPFSKLCHLGLNVTWRFFYDVIQLQSCTMETPEQYNLSWKNFRECTTSTFRDLLSVQVFFMLISYEDVSLLDPYNLS